MKLVFRVGIVVAAVLPSSDQLGLFSDCWMAHLDVFDAGDYVTHLARPQRPRGMGLGSQDANLGG
jgi:hypothetical protein